MEARIATEDVRLLVDTGASTVLSRSLADRVGTKTLDSIPVTDASGDTIAMEIAELPLLTIGTLHFFGTSVIVPAHRRNADLRSRHRTR